ncbi:hypothetical protein [Mangrovimonas xylaniphaga]|uniref:hypothetical protein n=1 Tax=Mangrovimonas xylaniphaga TaxID=1645915 RepID=UPI000B11C6B0|nr:hypothetical protein [Mangrovimonas xylaniphaga]
MKRITLYLSLFLPILCFSQDYILSNEKSIFEFETIKGKRLVIALDSHEEYLVYRYGTNNNLEFEFPKNLSNSWDEFQFSWYLRGGGFQNEGLDINYLYFNNGNYRYVVFQEYSAHSQKTDYGIKVINLITEKESVILADPKTVKGSLTDFRDMELIKEGDELFD